MIISDEHRYVFVELPWTASTAISKELRAHYDGRSILTKHSNYRHFLRYASSEQRSYFVFSGIRHPLDEIVSLFVKFKTNPNAIYTNPEWWVSRRKLRRFRWVQEHNATFTEFIKRFYWLPAETWSSLDHKRFDYVYRFESVVTDFDEILRRLGIQPVRALPMVHSTKGKGAWEEYYTPDIYDRIRVVFGPRMAEWGYDFPADWQISPAPSWATAIYKAKALAKNTYRRAAALFGPSSRSG